MRLFFLLLVVFAVLSPVVWALLTALKPHSEIVSGSLLPKQWTLLHFRQVVAQPAFVGAMVNSLLIASVTVVVSLAISTLAALALGRGRFRGRKTLLLSFLALSMFPHIALLCGLFIVINSFGLYDRIWGVIFSYFIFTLPFTVWTLTAFVGKIPVSIEQAAYVEGASLMQTLWHIQIPLLTPGVITTGAIALVTVWNEFLFALTLTITDRSITVPVVISSLSGASHYELPWGMIMAGALLATVPVVVGVVLMQKRIVSGLTVGALKG